ncbi:MAG: glutamine synthetase III [Brevinema sp.]
MSEYSTKQKDVPSFFGSKVFNDNEMQARLSPEVYQAFQDAASSGQELPLFVADGIAEAMLAWAVENGAIHFTHWFQPMTGVTAEKHNSFIEPLGRSQVGLAFSGKELIKGESDASSFPNGGLRATFEARGYTAWDPSSYAFIKDDTLCIPTAFCSYGGESLDTKTPLLRSIEALDRQARRILSLFGHKDVKKVIPTVGPEQEYFLIDKNLYLKRPDLIHCGRTLFGARALKGQDLEDHYYGAIKPKVSLFMKELEDALWRLGVYAKTKHNEVAPGQHEFAPIFTSANVAADHNQLTMELMKSIADKHGFACLMHEKPFAGINGSGKHNNWALSTDSGINLLEPGETPHENAQFILFLTAVIHAVDEYQDLLRASVASASNDHRLGANEAPPAIISIFLGDELTAILEALETGAPYVSNRKNLKMDIGVTMLPPLNKDVTDRNRTSPFAFTGNKFEYRMPGSSASISSPNVALNTIVAEILSRYADELEKGKGNFHDSLNALIRKNISDHKRIIFNGNNYSGEWKKEAEKRGLYNLQNAPDALEVLKIPKNVDLFERHKVLSSVESHSRYEILVENYIKIINMEAMIMLHMVQKNIMPDLTAYEQMLTSTINAKKALNADIPCDMELSILKRCSALGSELITYWQQLDQEVKSASAYKDHAKKARYYRDTIVSSMCNLRSIIDPLESIVPSKYWSLPTYEDMLYSIR